MARFDIYRVQRSGGYLLDIQADFLSHLDTRVVVPLMPLSDAIRPLKTLNPIFTLEEERFVMATQLLVAIPRSALQNYAGNLSHKRDDIISATDFLMQGF